MRDILKHFDIVTEADAQIKNLAQQLDNLVDNLDDEPESSDEKSKPAKSNREMQVFGRRRQQWLFFQVADKIADVELKSFVCTQIDIWSRQ